jgi:hypothetical protein
MTLYSRVGKRREAATDLKTNTVMVIIFIKRAQGDR